MLIFAGIEGRLGISDMFGVAIEGAMSAASDGAAG
jgi:hypothetical protein